MVVSLASGEMVLGLRVIASVNAASDILARKTVHAALADLGLALQAAGLRYTHEEDPQSS